MAAWTSGRVTWPMSHKVLFQVRVQGGVMAVMAAADGLASIIVCVRNRPVQVVTCLDSLLGLSDDNFEIVVVDDASTDSTPAVLIRFQEEHSDRAIRIVRNEVSRGLCHARNVGIDAAHGDLILFTDSDCAVPPQWLRRFREVFFDPTIVAASGLVRDAAPTTYAERAFSGVSAIRRKGWQRRDLIGCNMAFRRDVLETSRFDEGLTYYSDEDDLARRLRRCGKRIGFAEDAVVLHQHHMNTKDYLLQARRHGEGAARYWYKHGVYLGRDVILLVAAVAALPLCLLGGAWYLIPLALLGLHGAALLVNEVALKGKRLGEAIYVLPLVIIHSVVKATSAIVELTRIALGFEPRIVLSKQAMLRSASDVTSGCRIEDAS